MANLEIHATTSDGKDSFFYLNASTEPHATVEVMGGALASVRAVRVGDIYPVAEVVFEPACTPANPFYIRWINRDGGFEYQMFDQHKAFTDAAGGFVEFSPSFDSTTAASRTREVLDMTECKATAAVGLEGLDRATFDRLRGIIYSPRIDHYNEKLERWEGVTLDGNTSVAWDTHGSLGSVEFTFRLKEVQLQF